MRTIRLLAAAAVLAPLSLQAQVSASWSLPASCSTTSVSGSFGSGTVQFTTSTGVINSVQNVDGTWCTDNSGNPFAQSGTTGSYWTQFGGAPSTAYGPAFGPVNMSMVQLVNEVSGTITFGQTVVNPWIFLTSVGNTDQNGVGVAVTYDFSAAFTILASNNNATNAAYWDNWTTPGFEPTFDVVGNSLIGREFSGWLQFEGEFDQLSFTTTGSENWHGFTVGAREVSVPEPSSFALMAVGLVTLGALRRRRSA